MAGRRRSRSARPVAAPAPLAEDRSPGEPRGGTLYLVATPIGNLSDVTLRALDVLGSVARIAAEDTRVSRRLLDRHGITTPLVSFHARNAAARLPELVGHLHGGADLALVTDAGTPGVSDPGAELAAAWAAEGGRVVPIPGPSAVLAAVAGSGLAGARWSFEGFLPRSGRERKERLARVAADERGTVLFEAPSRVPAMLSDLAAACGSERPAAVCRELTKVHEEFLRATLGELTAMATDGRITLRGEFAIVVGAMSGEAVTERRRSARMGESSAATPRAGPGVSPRGDLDDARAQVETLVHEGLARGEAARRVAAATGLPRRALYGAAAEPS